MADIDDDSTKWFETDASNTQAPPSGWPAGMLPNQVEPTAQAMMGAIKRFWNRINGIYSSAGSAARSWSRRRPASRRATSMASASPSGPTGRAAVPARAATR